MSLKASVSCVSWKARGGLRQSSELVLSLTKALPSAPLIRLKYVSLGPIEKVFRTFWKILQKISQKQNSVMAWCAEGNEPADFPV